MDIQIVVSHPGDADSLRRVAYEPESPGVGEIRVRHHAIGVNFLDVYHRRGLYVLPAPGVPGVEAAGVVEALGPGVTGLAVGQRIAYAGAPVGAYRSTRLLPARRAIALPDDISARVAAVSLLKGLTVDMLLTRSYAVVPGTVLLVHAAAGGLGMMLTRWAKQLGAVVIGTVGSESKATLARENGADHVIVGREADIVGEVLAWTHGRGVDYAIDGIGGDMLARTLACVRRFGTVASIGQVAGPIPPLPVALLGPVRALSLARPSVMAYADEHETYVRGAARVWEALAAGIASPIGGEYELADAARAHADLEAGHSTGSLLLIP